MMRFKYTQFRFVLCVVLLLLVSTSGLAESGQTTRVLFIGNSYTYYNSMPHMFQAMAENLFPDQTVEVDFICGGGATLEKHWDVGWAQKEILTGTWDFVVLQEQSMLGSNNLSDKKSWKTFYTYARKFDEIIKENGGETVFFLTWSRQNSRDDQVYLNTAYITIAEKLNSKVAPVGLVWDRVRDEDRIELYNKDGSHPSVSGSFLTAITILSTVFGVQPQGTSGHLQGYEILRGGVLATEKSILSDLKPVQVQVIENAVK